MWSRMLTGLRSRLVMTVLAALVSGSCTPAAQRQPGAGSVAAAGRSTAVVPTSASLSAPVPVSEAQTISLALDRIDQLDLPLDHTYRHVGTGHAVSVYVFDGGIMELHPELMGRVRRGFDAFPGEERLCNAHGTAVAGAIGGRTLGVAPDVRLVDVKMVECRRMRGSIDAIVRATHWVIADHALHPGQRAVANWSFIRRSTARSPCSAPPGSPSSSRPATWSSTPVRFRRGTRPA
jgi:subtilisin family serine protease